ncbi:MAG: type IX secretion system protein PorQ [Cyclobacteriaceae bacterium]
MKKAALLILLVMSAAFSYGQIGGKRAFEFLNIPTNARAAGLGGVIISATDNDAAMFLSNPALLSSENDNYLTFSHLGFYADIKFNTLSYVKDFEKWGPVGIGIQRMSYGSFESYDAAGVATGKFDASETAITISKSHQVGPFTLGANLKFAQSSIYTYSASALFLDLGGIYSHPEQELVIALKIKSLGLLLSDYTDGNNADLPLDVQAGVTFKPKYMPFRFTFTAFNLNRENTAYFDSTISDSDNSPGQIDKIFRHINIGTEIVLGKNFNIRLGYNHLLRKEMRLISTAGGAGFNFGFLVKVKAFELAYTNATYHAAGGRSYFTFSSNLNRILKKKTKN